MTKPRLRPCGGWWICGLDIDKASLNPHGWSRLDVALGATPEHAYRQLMFKRAVDPEAKFSDMVQRKFSGLLQRGDLGGR